MCVPRDGKELELWYMWLATLVELEQNCFSPFRLLTLCSSVFVDNFYRLFTRFSHLGPFTSIEDHAGGREAVASIRRGRAAEVGGDGGRVVVAMTLRTGVGSMPRDEEE